MSKQKPKQKPEEEKKNLGGAPTLWKPEYNDQAYKLALLGYTDKELADFWGVTEQTINNWKKDKDGNPTTFFESLKKGKDLADAEVSLSLFNRAKGYSHPETKAFCFEGCIVTEDVTKHYPPDTAAAFIWLKNRQRKLWQDRQEIKHEIEAKTDFDKLCEMAEKEGLKVEDYCKREGINLDDYR